MPDVFGPPRLIANVTLLANMRTRLIRFTIAFVLLLGLQVLLILVGSEISIVGRRMIIVYKPFFTLLEPVLSHHSEGDLGPIILWGSSLGAFVYSTVLTGLVALLSKSQPRVGGPHA